MATAVGREEKEVLNAYLLKNHLKRSEQREAILDAFLRAEKHVSVDDLLNIVQKRHPDIGRTTVYRTLKLLQEAGRASCPWTAKAASSPTTSAPTTTISSASRAATSSSSRARRSSACRTKPRMRSAS